MKKITPFLWFDNKAEEAMNYYISIFKNSKVLTVTHYKEGGPMPAGTVMTAAFELDGQEFVALNGGPLYKFTEAVSFSINCDTQQEIDHYWDKLSKGGEIQMCGWLKDKFELSWQVVPTKLGQYFDDKDPARAQRVMKAMLKMQKFDIRKLEEAYEG